MSRTRIAGFDCSIPVVATMSGMLTRLFPWGDSDRRAEFVEYLSSRFPRRPSASDDHQVDIFRQLVTRRSEPLANTTFDPVSDHGITHRSTHRHSETTISRGIGCIAMTRISLCHRHQKIARTVGLALVPHSPEITRLPQPIRRPEGPGSRRRHRCLDPTETVSECRFFERLRFNIARPARVLIRLRKPCFRFLLIRLG